MNKGLLKYAGKKLIRLILMIAAVSIVTFALIVASPVDPVKTNVGQAALGSMSQEQIHKLEEYWGVNTPPFERYANWAKDFVRGDMGTSLIYRRSVSEVIGEKLKNSIVLMTLAWIISGVLGYILGAFSGMKRGRLPDRIVKGYCVVVGSTPVFWIALLLLMIFGVWLGWLPIGFRGPIGMASEDVTFLERLRHGLLPAIALSITGVGNIALHTREKITDIMESDYILFARARGQHGWQLFKHHVFRNSLIPALTLEFASIGEIIGGSVVVEQVFSYPGMGQAAVAAGLGGDLPLLMGISIITAVIAFAGNFVADILYHVIDPRMRKGGQHE